MKKVKLIISVLIAAMVFTSAAYAENETNTNVVSSNPMIVEDGADIKTAISTVSKVSNTLSVTVGPLMNYMPVSINDVSIKYICKETDTLKSLAKTAYKDEKYYLYLAKSNGIDCRSKLTVGQLIKIKIKPDESIQTQAAQEEADRVAKEEAERLEKERQEAERKKKEAEEAARKKAEQAAKGTYIGDFKLTFYTPDPAENGGSTLTATGKSLSANVWRAIAVDPRVIKLGSTVYIEGLGTFRAEDTGGAIKGNRIDVLVNYGEANRLGVQYRKVYVK